MGVDEDFDDSSFSEDEGVEVDLDESDTDEPVDTRLLHQLAASLAQELKYAKQNTVNSNKLHQSQNLGLFDHHEISKNSSAVQGMDLCPQEEISEVLPSPASLFSLQNTQSSHQVIQRLQFPPPAYPQYPNGKLQNSMENFDNRVSPAIVQRNTPHHHLQPRLESPVKNFDFGSNTIAGFRFYPTVAASSPHQEEEHVEMAPAYTSSTFSPPLLDHSYPSSRVSHELTEGTRSTDPVSWGIGWDACTTEALRYLLEDEGLPPNHPTVLAMKNHLDLQRARVLSQFPTA